MDQNARLLLVERTLEPDPQRGQPSTYLLDTMMMVAYGQARERTADEFGRLLEQSGLKVERVVKTPSTISIVEATPLA